MSCAASDSTSHRQTVPIALDFDEADLDFIHVLIVDLNGVARGKVIPASGASALVRDGCHSEISITAFGYDGHSVEIDSHSRHNFGNINLRVIPDTLRLWPWHGLQTGARIGQVLCSAHWPDGRPLEVDSRAMALKQLNLLKERGLEIFCGSEIEFRLFKESSTIENPCPSHEGVNMYLPQHYRLYEKFYVQMDKRLRSLDINYTTFHTENGKGQMEMPMFPDWGILSADNMVRMKLLTRDTASDVGYKCSFMTKPLEGDSGNGFHLNHSIWRRHNGKKPDENVLLDENDPDKISAFARHWIAGLIYHGAALTAICSPTVNCYRRLHTIWAPDYNDWAIDDRMVAIRVKNGGTANSTFIENRNPSSASNPYLVMAGVIAAGLDGVDKKLELPEQHSKVVGPLPRSLPEALEALGKDTLICEALGEQFMNWFTTVKEKEVEHLKGVNIIGNDPKDFERERGLYFDCA